jgi:hypothetical protein
VSDLISLCHLVSLGSLPPLTFLSGRLTNGLLQIQLLVAFQGEGKDVMNSVARWLKDEASDKCNKELDTSTWRQVSPQGGVPQQLNGCDCGIFVLM